MTAGACMRSSRINNFAIGVKFCRVLSIRIYNSLYSYKIAICMYNPYIVRISSWVHGVGSLL